MVELFSTCERLCSFEKINSHRYWSLQYLIWWYSSKGRTASCWYKVTPLPILSCQGRGPSGRLYSVYPLPYSTILPPLFPNLTTCSPTRMQMTSLFHVPVNVDQINSSIIEEWTNSRNYNTHPQVILNNSFSALELNFISEIIRDWFLSLISEVKLYEKGSIKINKSKDNECNK